MPPPALGEFPLTKLRTYVDDVTSDILLVRTDSVVEQTHARSRPRHSDQQLGQVEALRIP